MSANSTEQKKTESKKTKRSFTAKEKCEAVLSVWSERRKPSEVCQDLEITWQQFENWQKVGIRGMLNALEPRWRPEKDRPAPLGPRVEKLLSQTELQARRQSRLDARLKALENSKKSAPQQRTSAERSPSA